MADYTNEPPKNSGEFLKKVKYYVEKAYKGLNKQALQKVLAGSNIDIVKTGEWSKKLHGHSEAKTNFYVSHDALDIATPVVRAELRDIVYKILQAENAGLEIIELDLIPKFGVEEVSIEEDVIEMKAKIEKTSAGITLPDDLVQKGKEMSEAYHYLYIVENTLRIFIDKVANDAGAKLIFTKEVQTTIDRNKASEAQNKFIPLRGQSDLFYCDFVQLQNIMLNNWQLFGPYFPQKDQHWLRVKIEDMYRVRNLIAHCGYVDKNSLDLVKANFNAIVGQLK